MVSHANGHTSGCLGTYGVLVLRTRSLGTSYKAAPAAIPPVPVQMWQGRAQSWCGCGRGEPSPGADVAGLAHSDCRGLRNKRPSLVVVWAQVMDVSQLDMLRDHFNRLDGEIKYVGHTHACTHTHTHTLTHTHAHRSKISELYGLGGVLRKLNVQIREKDRVLSALEAKNRELVAIADSKACVRTHARTHAPPTHTHTCTR
jgi:hypothetical protein